ncbi:hypothetical protein BH09GEM1_BH09GEM1_45960 [soil metagenome]
MSLCLGHAVAPTAAAARPKRVNHVKCAPAPELVPFVEHYWVSRWDRTGQPAKESASLLDPCVHLQVHDGRAEVMGVRRGAYRVRIEGVGCVVGAKFRPGAFHSFVSRPVREWTDRVVPAEGVFGGAGERWAREVSSAVLNCDGDADDHVAIITAGLDAVLGARLPARDAVAEDVGELVALIASRADVRWVRDLVRASGRSERTLDRLFARYVGVSPA